jgi:AcrR family transcriptional regulator
MPKLKPATQQARREKILDAAEVCFARTGFHRTTMADICKEAGISAGALYVYFASKEALIAGIAERDREQLAEGLKEVGAAPDLVAALGKLGEHYAVAQPHYKRVLFAEIGVESTRNPAVGDIFRACDSFCLHAFTGLLERAQAEGRIAAGADPAILAQAIAVIGDGLFWRRAVDPAFDPAAVLPIVTRLVGLLLAPEGVTAATAAPLPTLDPMPSEPETQS